MGDETGMSHTQIPIIRSIVSLATELDLTVIAEGVDCTGPGEGTGTGPGKGPGSGGGISFDLANRTLIRKPSIDDKSQETGRVVVSITVDKDGNVTEARPGARGSTTTSAYLFGKAKEAAMKAKFSPNPDGADIQKGTMTFVFLVQ